MKNKALKIINLIVAALVCAFAIGYAFAWFPESRRTDDVDFNGSSGQTYFAGGSGTADAPFIINDKYHLYNLAWLQNTGKLTTKYYFELDGNLSIPENFWLPPIGTDEYEFIGDFNGKGNTISGLQITTDKSKLSKVGLPSGSSAFSNAVGMFGMTGSGSEIHNFVLDTPIVEVATANATYSQSSDRTVGLAIGMVSGKAYSIGVLADEGGDGAQLLLNRAGYSTFNSIIGALKANTTSSVTGGGYLGSGGSGNAFGASFDVEGLLTRLELIKANKSSESSSVLLPDLNNEDLPISGEKLAFTVDSTLSTYNGANAQEVVANNNIGYFLGNQNKVDSKTMEFAAPLVLNNGIWTSADGSSPTISSVPLWFYKNTWEGDYTTNNSTYSQSSGFDALTTEEFNALPDSIKNLLPADPTSTVDYTSLEPKTFDRIRISQGYNNLTAAQNYGNTNNANWSYHGQISWMGKTYGEGFMNADGYAVDENGNLLVDPTWGSSPVAFNSYTGGIALPNCAIWFKPSQTGKIRFVMYSNSTNGKAEGFSLLKVTRTNATASNPFYSEVTEYGQDIHYEVIIKAEIPAFVFIYYEYDVTQEDIDAGNIEYMLMLNSEAADGGAYFLYLDIGSSAADDNDASLLDPDTDVSAIDFIYSGVTISTNEEETGIAVGNFIIGTSGSCSAYEATKTSVYFENLNTILQIVFVRPENGKNADGATLIVTVSASDGLDEIKQTKTTASITT